MRSAAEWEGFMLRGDRVGIRARHEADIAVLQAELYDDVETRIRADSRPWRPIPPIPTASPYWVGEATDDVAFFSVVDLADDRLAGEALLWGMDLHNRTGHIGVAILPEYRGRGFGSDVVRLLCAYGFEIRGLHRLQVDTLADNLAMIRAATDSGFVHEGTLRRAAWVNGEFVDEVVLGLINEDRRR